MNLADVDNIMMKFFEEEKIKQAKSRVFAFRISSDDGIIVYLYVY